MSIQICDNCGVKFQHDGSGAIPVMLCECCASSCSHGKENTTTKRCKECGFIKKIEGSDICEACEPLPCLTTFYELGDYKSPKDFAVNTIKPYLIYKLNNSGKRVVDFYSTAEAFKASAQFPTVKELLQKYLHSLAYTEAVQVDKEKAQSQYEEFLNLYLERGEEIERYQKQYTDMVQQTSREYNKLQATFQKKNVAVFAWAILWIMPTISLVVGFVSSTSNMLAFAGGALASVITFLALYFLLAMVNGSVFGKKGSYRRQFVHNFFVHPLMMFLPAARATQLHDKNAAWAYEQKDQH